MNNEKIVTNLETLLAAVEAYPETNLDLCAYKLDGTECGTLYCVAGLAATLPHFIAQGMRFEEDKFGGIAVKINDGSVTDDCETDPMFGEDSWYNLFATYGNGKRDEVLGAYDVHGYNRMKTHKELALARLNAQLAAVKGEAQ